MADSAVAITAGTGTSIDTRTEGTNGNHRQVIVIGDPATNAGVAPVDATAGLKVDLGADNDVTLATLPDTAAGDLAAINTLLGTIDTDTGNMATSLGSLDNAVDGNYLNVNLNLAGTDVTAGAGAVAAGTPRMTLASDDPAVAKLGTIDTDTGNIATASAAIQAAVEGTLTVDLGSNNDVTVTSGNITADTELTTADLDTGAGTDTRAVVGLVGSKSGGGELIPGSATDGLLVNLGSNNDVTMAVLPDTVGGDLSSIASDVATLQSAISANEMQVNVAEPLPAGTNNIGDVDVASIAAGTNVIGKVRLVDSGGTEVTESTDHSMNVTIVADDVGIGGGTQYTEDAAAAANPVGNALMLVREDARAGSLTTTDGDNVAARGNNKGEMYVKDTDAGALLGTIGTDTGNIASGVASIDGKITACDTGAVVLAAGTAAIGKLAANSGVDIGDVDVASVAGNVTVVQGTATNLKTQAEAYQGGSAVAAGNPLQVSVANTGANGTAIKVNVASGGIASGAIASGAIASGAIASGAIAAGAVAAGATSIADNEDVASAGGDRLVKVAAIRNDTPVANDNVSANGDYTQLKLDNFGKLWVAGSVPEDTAHIDGESILRGGSRRIDTLATSAGTSGDWATRNQSAEGAEWVTPSATTNGGTSTYYNKDLDETKVAMKASAGNIYSIVAFNTTAAPLFLQLFDAASASVTVGSTTPTNQYVIPGNADSDGAGFVINFAVPKSYGTAITIACTTNSEGSSAPGTGACIINIEYK